MGVVHTIRNAKIKVLAERNHVLGHFHVFGPNFGASISIENFDVLAGDSEHPIVKKAIEWAKIPTNQKLLVNEWERLNAQS